ncbi:ParB N-terminal domain-containing protein [Roseovarius confluentis]|uniref:ParB N-terminal domain-containing protein n=1 Tax=Roseovarius confluentis TaxID=1852027 RepID=UPI003BAD1ED9
MTLRNIDVAGEERRPAPKDARPELRWIRVDQLVINTGYQRAIEARGRSTIRKIADNFCWSKFGALDVNRVGDTTFEIIDGQHRTHAAALCGIEEVPALVKVLTPQQAAAAFSWINGMVTALTPNQVFRAALAALEPWAVQCDATVSRAGCRLMPVNKSSKDKKPGEVFCVTLIRQMVDADKGTFLVAALDGLMADARQGGAATDPTLFGGVWLRTLTEAAQSCGVTRGEVIADFLAQNDIWSIEKACLRLRADRQGEYYNTPMHKLLTDAVTAKLRAWQAGKVAA